MGIRFGERIPDEGAVEPDQERTEDVIDLLSRQHEQVRALFAAIELATADERESLFRELVRLLSVHETAEQELVHPAIAELGGAEVVTARVAEERRATELLSTLTELGSDAEGFDTLLAQLREDVLAHAEHEESAEFPILRQGADHERLVSMAGAVRAAERIAPTRPPPGVESPAANLLLRDAEDLLAFTNLPATSGARPSTGPADGPAHPGSTGTTATCPGTHVDLSPPHRRAHCCPAIRPNLDRPRPGWTRARPDPQPLALDQRREPERALHRPPRTPRSLRRAVPPRHPQR